MKRISYVYDPADGCADITVPHLMIAEFAQMVQRATSTWQDMSPDMRDFADRVLGRDKVMGSNMKEGYETSCTRPAPWDEDRIKTAADIPPNWNKQLVTRSCCGTLLREPHHAQCPHISGVPVTPREKTICTKCHFDPCHCSFIG